MRGGGPFSLTSNQASVLSESFCCHMADGEAPRLCNDVAGHRGLRRPDDAAHARRRLLRRRAARALRRRPRRQPRRAVAPAAGRFSADDEQVLLMLARVLAAELERESNQRDLRRLNDSLRDQARGMGAVGRVARVLAGGEDARKAVCRAACELTGAPIAFLLEPSGREFCSTAMAGVELAPVTIQPRAETQRPRVHGARELLRGRRPQPPGARRAAGRRDRRALGAVRAGAARRPGRRRADHRLEDAAGRAARRPTAGLLRRAHRAGRGGDRARRPARARREPRAERRR